MVPSEFEYKVLNLSDHLEHTNNADLTLEIQAKLGWEVQQIFNRGAAETDTVYVLMRRPRKRD